MIEQINYFVPMRKGPSGDFRVREVKPVVLPEGSKLTEYQWMVKFNNSCPKHIRYALEDPFKSVDIDSLLNID